MTQGGRSSNEVEARLTGMAIRVLHARANDDPEEPGPDRDIIDSSTALGALDLVVMGIDRARAQGIRLDVDLASHLMAMLMVVREFIEPLPAGIRADGSDGLSEDLAIIVERLERAGLLDWTMSERGYR